MTRALSCRFQLTELIGQPIDSPSGGVANLHMLPSEILWPPNVTEEDVTRSGGRGTDLPADRGLRPRVHSGSSLAYRQTQRAGEIEPRRTRGGLGAG